MSFSRILAAILALVLLSTTTAEARPPIIDMHIHARRVGPIAGATPLCAPPIAMPRWENNRPIDEGLHVPGCLHALQPEPSGEAVMRGTLAIMKRRNIIAMASGEPVDIARWRAAAPDRIIRGLDLRIVPRPAGARFQARSPEEVRALYKSGAFDVLGEIMAQYDGVTADDPRMEPYWALAEELDIPVAIHMGPGAGGDAYSGDPVYLAANSNPLRLEPVLIRHPRLRIYVMHAGYPFIDDLLALLEAHPQVYVDIAAIDGTEPRAAFYGYLRAIVDAGFSDRVMFGTDQGVWPALIERSIEAIEKAPFLTARQKRNILYNNAARFLRLDKAEIARHQAM
jgi:predicted TIM-barrel fold metal-dependent hydrolase